MITWIDKQGEEHIIRLMDNNHLDNTINMLQRNIKKQTDNLDACCPMMAHDWNINEGLFEISVDKLEERKEQLKVMLKEQKRRKGK